MTAIIPHTDYDKTRDDLLRALESGEPQPLDHPFYGRIENIVARSFTINERLSDLGRAELTIQFAVSDKLAVPKKAKNSFSEALFAKDSVFGSCNVDLAEKFEVDEGFMGNFTDAQELFADISDAFGEVTSFIGVITDKIDQFAANVNEFTSDINALISLPQQFADSIEDAFSSVENLFASVENTFNAITSENFFDFGDSYSHSAETTQGIVQRNKNRDIVSQAMQTFAVAEAYAAATQIEFGSTEEIEAVSVILEEQYVKIVSLQTVSSAQGVNEFGVQDNNLSLETVRALEDLRTIANTLLDEKKQSTRSTITIYTQRMPMAVLAYQYYGNTDLTDDLLALNDIKGAAFVEGELKVFTQ